MNWEFFVGTLYGEYTDLTPKICIEYPLIGLSLSRQTWFCCEVSSIMLPDLSRLFLFEIRASSQGRWVFSVSFVLNSSMQRVRNACSTMAGGTPMKLMLCFCDERQNSYYLSQRSIRKKIYIYVYILHAIKKKMTVLYVAALVEMTVWTCQNCCEP